MIKKTFFERGLTLVELILVVAIVGILAAAIVASFNPFEQLAKSDDARRKADLSQLQRALELYYQDTGSYPASSPDYKIYLDPTTITWGEAWLPYMPKLPNDPKLANSYVYYSPPSSNGQSYYLYASLGRGEQDPQSCNNGNACISLDSPGFPAATACGGICNYGVSSSNVAP